MRSPFEDRPGGKRYRSQLERIERAVTITGLLLLALLILAIVYLIRHF